jgi:hypothetical protein
VEFGQTIEDAGVGFDPLGTGCNRGLTGNQIGAFVVTVGPGGIAEGLGLGGHGWFLGWGDDRKIANRLGLSIKTFYQGKHCETAKHHSAAQHHSRWFFIVKYIPI